MFKKVESSISGYIRICCSKTLIVFDRKIVHAAGEQLDNGKAAPPPLFAANRFLALTISFAS